jgi:hypothetical protein
VANNGRLLTLPRSIPIVGGSAGRCRNRCGGQHSGIAMTARRRAQKARTEESRPAREGVQPRARTKARDAGEPVKPSSAALDAATSGTRCGPTCSVRKLACADLRRRRQRARSHRLGLGFAASHLDAEGPISAGTGWRCLLQAVLDARIALTADELCGPDLAGPWRLAAASRKASHLIFRGHD